MNGWRFCFHSETNQLRDRSGPRHRIVRRSKSERFLGLMCEAMTVTIRRTWADWPSRWIYNWIVSGA